MGRTVDKSVLVRLPVGMHREIKKQAKREDRSMSALIRQAIGAYLNGQS